MTAPTLLRGATAVRQVVAEYLADAMPTVVAMARTEWGLDEHQLPLPVAYDAYEPAALDKWPLVGITIAQAGKFNRVNYWPDMSQQYLTQYTVRVYTWVRTPLDEDEIPIEPEYSEAIRLRDDLAACIRTALLLTGGFGVTGVLWDESSLSEDYSETEPVRGERYVSGVVHTFTMTYDETVTIPQIGTADAIGISGHMLNEAFVPSPPIVASLSAVCVVS